MAGENAKMCLSSFKTVHSPPQRNDAIRAKFSIVEKKKARKGLHTVVQHAVNSFANKAFSFLSLSQAPFPRLFLSP